MNSLAANASHPQKTKRNLLAKFALILLFAALPARFLLSRIDHGEANVVFALCLILGSLLGVLAVLRSTTLSRSLKIVTLAVPAAILFFGFVRYQFVGFSGELVPLFRVRGTSSDGVGSLSSGSVSAPTNELSEEAKATVTGEFTQFLGNERTGIVDGIRLASDWQLKPPRILWKKPIGPGWSGFAIKNGLAITLEEYEGSDSLVAMNASDGKLAWRVKLGRKHFHAVGGAGPRSTPTVQGDRVYAQSSTGIVAACNLADGKLLWSVDLLELAKISQSEAESSVSWGRSGSPLVVKDLVIVPFGGKSNESPGSLIALSGEDGQEKWRGGTDQISYSSPSLMQLHGEQQVVIVNESSVAGHNPEDGTSLWQFDWPGQSNGGASVSQTILVSEERLFLSKGYHVGSMLLDFSKSLPNATIVSTVWKNAALLKTKFTNVVLLDGFLYGLSDGIMECVRVDDGKKMWKDGRHGRFGHGQILLIGNHILIATEEGECVLAQASPEKLVVLGRLPVIEGVTWNPLAIVGDRVFMRNGQEAACLRVPLENAP